MPETEDLPSYEPLLASYHSAFATELEAMIAALPIQAGDRILEMACGDGAYTAWLAARVGPKGSVTAVDISTAYLEAARRATNRTSLAPRIKYVAAPIEKLPFPGDSFDLVWCAQSLYSLPNQLESLKTMVRLTKPGGQVAVLDNDTIHQIILPWPPDLELAVRLAELNAFRQEKKPAETYYVGRRLTQLFLQAGLESIQARSYASTRQAPLGAPERAFLIAYFDDLSERVTHRLEPDMRLRYLALSDPSSDNGLVNQRDLAFVCLDQVVIGMKPK